MTTPLVSVIIATYNWSAVLPYSVGSVLGQTLTDFEVLVVGDGCTDDSEAVVAGLGDSRVRWINLPANTGTQSGPNNEGLRQARGRYVAYLGHDDLWLPHHLACLVPALEAGADFANGMTMLVRPAPGEANEEFADNVTAPLFMAAYRPGRWMPPTGVAHRRGALQALGGWGNPRELRILLDTDVWRRAHAAGCSFAFVPRFSAVKFPARWRRTVYLTRPCHEQAAWFARIQREDALEMTELAKTVLALQPSLLPVAYPLLWANLWQETRLRLARRLSNRKKPRAAWVPGSPTEESRRLKGLDPKF